MQSSLFEPGCPFIFTRSTGERVDATIKGPSEQGERFAVFEYMKGGQVATHSCAPLQIIEFFIQFPCPSPELSTLPQPAPVVLVCVARKRRLCPSYSRRRDRINLVLWCSLYGGRGGGGGAVKRCIFSRQVMGGFEGMVGLAYVASRLFCVFCSHG